MNIIIEKTTKDEIKRMTHDYYKYLLAPMDDMWEKSIIFVADYYKISVGTKDVGYFCLNDNNDIVQFYIKNQYLKKAKEIFEYLLVEMKINKAYVSTLEPRFYNLCLDHNKGIKTHTYLYKDMFKVNSTNPIKNAKFNLATDDEYLEVLNYERKNIGLEGDWVGPYYEKLIEKQELYLLRVKNEIIGTGELRPSESNKSYANVGVTVGTDYRRQAVASFILSYLKDMCYKREIIAICSTTVDNIGSQKAIEKAGLYAYHRVVEVEL